MRRWENARAVSYGEGEFLPMIPSARVGVQSSRSWRYHLFVRDWEDSPRDDVYHNERMKNKGQRILLREHGLRILLTRVN